MHHNTEAWREQMERLRAVRPDQAYPLDIEDTGEELCRLCDHKRSQVDGQKVCLLCALYLFAGPNTHVAVFAPKEWGSVNEPNLCSDDTIVAIGHVAAQVSRRKVKYAAMKFKFDPKTGKRSQLRIIATRKSFPSGRAKRQGLADVVYPAGTRSIDGRVMLYAGTGDAEVQRTDVSGCVDFG